ncbi:MAG TPA: carbohydrate ABC transporter permease [Fusicatenibacter saccharivorans]|nr:carbohydrate ABC transporter permease [Fusicatenibacter saccharivorans]
MIQSKSLGSKIFNVFNIILMSLLSLSCLYPLWYTLCLSVSDKAAANSGKVSFYPVGFSLASYQQIMGDTQFFRSFLISAERTIFGTIFTIVVLAIFAYPLSKSANEYHPKNVIMWIVIFCMLFNGGTIPWYITMVNYGMIDNMVGLILCGGLPVFNLILLINFYRSLPKELMEAAEIDGAGVWTVLFRIVVPCAIPIFATLILFTSVGYWNEYFQGLVHCRLTSNRWSLISRQQIFRWIRSKRWTNCPTSRWMQQRYSLQWFRCWWFIRSCRNTLSMVLCWGL